MKSEKKSLKHLKDQARINFCKICKELSRQQFYRSFSQLGASRLIQCLQEAKAKEKGQ